MASARGLFGVCAVVLLSACGSQVKTDTSGSGAAAGQGGATSTTTGMGGMVNTTINTGAGAQGGGTVPCAPGPNDDLDGDGFSVNQGDCDDCAPGVNPGAVEVVVTEPDPNGNIPPPADEDCDGVIDEPEPLCDSGLALDDADPLAGAKALDLCQIATPEPVKWGVLKAAYVRANGAGTPDPRQWGIKPGFGPNVNAQGGQRLLVLSNGHARAVGDPDACGVATCTTTGAGTAPPGFPQDVPGCSVSGSIHDDVAIELQIRAPTNAKGYSFDLKFYSFEYPEWVCTTYNDQILALVAPPPSGSINGNIAFDKGGIPIGVNAGFVAACDPASLSSFAQFCAVSCPSPPSPYCPLGSLELAGTGFQEWDPAYAGATPWLRTTAPVVPGSVFTIRLAIWDTGDQSLDSTVLFDHWQWITGGASVTVGTAEIPDPK
jgi:hypothetical protein